MAPGRFNIIYADPPWQYRTWSPSRRSRRTPYPCLTTSQICALPVQELAAKNCVLFLWAIYPMLPDALAVIDSWGFRFQTVGFTWCKENPSGNGYHFGMGYWTRANPELCLLATKGHPKRVSRSVANLVIAPRTDHSRKPAGIRDRIVELCGNVPRIELFAREKAAGWTVWGNEVSSDVAFEKPLTNQSPTSNQQGSQSSA